MNVYVYNADLWCESCADSIKEHLKGEGDEPENPEDEYSYDSDEWPEGPFSDDEADCPQYCGGGPDCLEAMTLSDGSKVGKFLENRLTIEGERYVKEQHAESPSEVTTMWMEFYGLSNSFDRRGCESRLRERLKELSAEDAIQILDTLTTTVLSWMDGDGEMDNMVECCGEMLDDLHNEGLDPTRMQ